MASDAAAVPGIQLATKTSDLTLAVLQVMLVQALDDEAVCSVQLVTGTLVWLIPDGVQVVVVQLLDDEADAVVQLGTPTVVVVIGVGQVRVT
jgi:hypothetical protein